MNRTLTKIDQYAKQREVCHIRGKFHTSMLKAWDIFKKDERLKNSALNHKLEL
jgi:hypothetical protein